jgi:hypothetical protein
MKEKKGGEYRHCPYSSLNLGGRWEWDLTPRQSARVLKTSPPRVFAPRTVRTVASHYTDWAIPAYTFVNMQTRLFALITHGQSPKDDNLKSLFSNNYVLLRDRYIAIGFCVIQRFIIVLTLLDVMLHKYSLASKEISCMSVFLNLCKTAAR